MLSKKSLQPLQNAEVTFYNGSITCTNANVQVINGKYVVNGLELPDFPRNSHVIIRNGIFTIDGIPHNLDGNVDSEYMCTSSKIFTIPLSLQKTYIIANNTNFINVQCAVGNEDNEITYEAVAFGKTKEDADKKLENDDGFYKIVGNNIEFNSLKRINVMTIKTLPENIIMLQSRHANIKVINLPVINIKGENGEIEISTYNKDDDYASLINIETISGNIVITANSKIDVLNCKSISGNININANNQTKIEEMNLKSISGYVDVNDCNTIDDLCANTTSGDIKIKGKTVFQNIFLKSTSGDICVNSTSILDGDVNNTSGHIKLYIENSPTYRIQKSLKLKTIKGTFGEVQVNTVSGDVIHSRERRQT